MFSSTFHVIYLNLDCFSNSVYSNVHFVREVCWWQMHAVEDVVHGVMRVADKNKRNDKLI